MRLNELVAVISILFVCMMVVNAVAAEDNTLVGTANGKLLAENENPTVLLDNSNNDGNVKLSAANSQEILQSNEVGNYTELMNLIDSDTDGIVSLDKDYAYSDSDKISSIKISNSITINGNGHKISGENKVMSFYIPGTTSHVTLNNITFVNGKGNSMLCIDGNNCIVDNCTFENNDATYGGAVSISGHDNTIDNCAFVNNAASYVGGAVYINGYGNSVRDSAFEGNYKASYGGAICFEGYGNSVYNCTFEKNSATTGGAIDIYNMWNVIDNCTFENNHASYYGAIYMESNHCIANNSIFIHNSADNNGGAIGVYGYNNTIDNSTFEYNTATWNDGGAVVMVYWYGPGTQLNNTIHASKFSYNEAVHYGGAVRVDSEYNTIDECEFYHNSAETGGAVSFNSKHNTIDNSIFEHNEATYGGAVNFNTEYLVINNTNMSFNKATQGGALYVALWAYHDVVDNCFIVDNEASSNGGAIYWIANEGTVNNSVFDNNHVRAFWLSESATGGAIFSYGYHTLINNSKFTSNGVDNYGGYSDGGALYLNGHNTVIANSKFENNVAGSNGGAVYLSGNEDTVYNSTFNMNRAGTEGGALYGRSENILIDNSTFTKNYVFFLGGAVALESSGIINDSSFSENTANKGGAIYWDALKGVVNNSNFYNNSAYYAGGALSLDYSYENAEKIIENCLFEENSCNNYGGAIASINTEIVNSTFKDNRAEVGKAIHSYSSKLSDITLINNDAVIQTTELIKITFPDDQIGNSTRKTNTSYTAVCVERYTFWPHLGLKDDSFSRVRNVITGEKISDYLKILVYIYFNSTEDIYRFKDETTLFYSEGDRDNPNHWDNQVYIPRIDYFSRAVHEFSDHDYWNSDHPLVLETLELYKTVYGNGTKMPDKFIKEVNGSLVEYDFSSMVSSTSQSLFLFKMIKHNMTIQKIALNNTVYLGSQTMFKIVVTNNGESNLTNITVKETEYDGLKLADYIADDLWDCSIETGNFVFTGTLKPGESSSFIVIFDTIKKGNLTNVVVGSNKNTTDKKANNTTEVVPIRVNVTKVWDDENNHDGLRPDNVTIYLLADGNKIDEIVLSEENGWNFIFNDLPMVKNGQVINYTVNEKPIANYAVNVIDDTVDDFNIIIANNTYIFTVINTHVPAVTSVEVVKVWNDSGNQDGVRPVSVAVVLLADGVKVAGATLDADNDWSATFAGLPVFDAGRVIVYSVQEVSVDGYTVEVANSSAYNFTVINTHIPVVTENDTNVYLVIEKTVSNSAPELGDEITWTITVTNYGPNIAENVVISDDIPAGLVLIDSDVYWVFDSIAPGESVSVAVKTLVNTSGTIINVATVTTTSNNNGDNKTNKTINVTTTVPIEIEVIANSTPSYGSELNDTEVIGKNDETDDDLLMIYEIPEITPEELIKFVGNKTPSSNVDNPVISVPDTPEPVINETDSEDNLTTPEVDVPLDVPDSNIPDETDGEDNSNTPEVDVPDSNIPDETDEDNPTDNPEDTPVIPKNNTPNKEQTHKKSKSNVEVNEKQTGNPIVVLLLTLMSIVALQIERKHK